MSSRKEAWALIHKYDKRIERLRWRFYNHGDNNAPFKRIVLMVEQEEKLKQMGWRFAKTPDGAKRQIEDVNTPTKELPLSEIEKAQIAARNGEPGAPLKLIQMLLDE